MENVISQSWTRGCTMKSGSKSSGSPGVLLFRLTTPHRECHAHNLLLQSRGPNNSLAFKLFECDRSRILE